MPEFVLRYRKPFGAVEDRVLAEDLLEAEAVGRTFCEKEPGLRYISVRHTVIADPSILSVETKAELVKRRLELAGGKPEAEKMTPVGPRSARVGA